MRGGFVPRRMVFGLLSVLVLSALVAGGKEGIRWLRTETLGGHAIAIDGDSLRLNGRELRLLGIDAPEYRQTCRRGDREEPCGRLARDRLASLLATGPVSCRISDEDRYGRGLAVCETAGTDISAALVRDGWAVAYGRYDAQEDEARKAGRGVWGSRFEAPADWRARHTRTEAAR